MERPRGGREPPCPLLQENLPHPQVRDPPAGLEPQFLPWSDAPHASSSHGPVVSWFSFLLPWCAPSSCALKEGSGICTLQTHTACLVWGCSGHHWGSSVPPVTLDFQSRENQRSPWFLHPLQLAGVPPPCL